MSNYSMQGEITYPFPKFNGATVVVSKWIIISLHTLLALKLIHISKKTAQVTQGVRDHQIKSVKAMLMWKVSTRVLSKWK